MKLAASLAWVFPPFLFATAQVLTVGLLGAPSATNIWAGYGLFSTIWDKFVLESQFLSLFWAVPPAWTWLPRLAEDFPSPFIWEDGYWVARVKLRQDVLWSDGTPFSADDVVFTFGLLLSEFDGLRLASLFGGRWPIYCPESLAFVEKVDDYQVKFAFLHPPTLGEWAFGVLACPIVQRDYWEPKFQAALQTEDPAGSLLAIISEGEPVLGGYQLVAYEVGSSVALERNPFYFASGESITLYECGGARVENPSLHYSLDAYCAQGEKVCELVEGPYFEKIVFEVFPSAEAALSALKNGEIAAILGPGLSPEHLGQIEDENVEIVGNLGLEFLYLAFNMRREPMNHRAFRAALATLIDQEVLCAELPGDFAPMYAPLPKANAFWASPNVSLPKEASRAERVTTAVRVLKEAGFSWDAEPKVVNPGTDVEKIVGVLPDGREVLAPRGFRLPSGQYCPELELLSVSPERDPVRAFAASFVAKRCKELAIPVTVNYLGAQEFLKRIWGQDGFDFDLYVSIWPIETLAFPHHLFLFWHSSQDVPGGFNTPGYRNPLYDQLAEAFLGAPSPAEARLYAFALQEILVEDLPYVFLAIPLVKEAYRPDKVTLPYKNVVGGLGYAWPVTVIMPAGKREGE